MLLALVAKIKTQIMFVIMLPDSSRFPTVRPSMFSLLEGPLNASSVHNLRELLQSGFEVYYNKHMNCRGCEASGGRCGSNPISGSFVCYCQLAVHSMDCSDGILTQLLWN